MNSREKQQHFLETEFEDSYGTRAYQTAFVRAKNRILPGQHISVVEDENGACAVPCAVPCHHDSEHRSGACDPSLTHPVEQGKSFIALFPIYEAGTK